MAVNHTRKLILDELNHTDEAVERLKRACEDEAAGPWVHGTNHVPIKQTFLEAFATIQRREEDRRKSSKQEAKSKNSKKSSNESNPQFRGTKIGVDPEVSAFWMVMEDYCRPVQPGDLQLLLPQHESLAEDTALFMPPLGFNPTQDEAPETDDGHDGPAAALDPTLDSTGAATGSVPVKADPVDSTMHEVTTVSAQQVTWEHNSGPTILHGAPAANLVNSLPILASLFPTMEADDSWQQIVDSATKEEGSVLDPALVERIRLCLAKTSDAGDSRDSMPGSVALNNYMHGLSCADKSSIELASVVDADSACAVVRGTDQAVGLDSDAVAAPERHTETVAADEVVHPYLQEHLQHVVLVDPVPQQGRKSPSLAAAPGTPVTDQPDSVRPNAIVPAGPSTPTTNGIEPNSECADPPEEKVTVREAGQENVVECGNEATDSALPSQPGTREASVDYSSMACSMDCSADVKDASMSTPGPAENSSASQAMQQQRRSSRKRNRQERDGDGVSAAKPPIKRAGTPHAAIVRDTSLSKHSSAKASEARDTPGEETPAAAEVEPAVRPKATRGGRAKGGAKAVSAKSSKGLDAAASCDSEGLQELVKPEPKMCTAALIGKESSARNGAAAGVALGDQEHDSTVLTCSAQEQWAKVNGALDVLAIAPDDEVVAEIISLQAELLQVVAANRKRCATVLNAVLDDLPAQTAKQAKQATAEEEMEAFLVHVRALKRQAKLEKREAERKEAAEALATSEAAGGALSGGAAAAAATGRVRRTASKHANAAHASDEDDDDEESEDEVGGVPLPLAGTSLVDPYALEVPDAINALCAVCGDGESKGNDQIVFCDRCNVAVHQQCYGVGEIPQGDWLCWPCKMYEDKLKAEGKKQEDIRPPRFKEAGNPDYPGGSKTIECQLCPMKRGIFKQTMADADGNKKWAHVVCSLWQTPECTVAPVNRPDVISGLANIKPENVSMTCAYCRQRTGATVKCAHPKCHTTFHPLCARKVGCFSVCHHPTGRGRPTYKTWCAQHSDAAERRERDAPARSAPVNGEKRSTGPKQPQPEPEVTISKEELAALEAQLSTKADALAFLQAVRFDLESARILAAQVEKREKGKMLVVDIIKQEFEMVLANPADFVNFESYLGCKRHHYDLVQLMQSTFEGKRQKARRQFASQHEANRQQQYLQQQQQVHQQQRMHHVEPMPSIRGTAPGMAGGAGQMLYGQHHQHAGAPGRGMRMGGQLQGQAERMSQPHQYGMQHSGMMGSHGGFGGGMMPEGDNLIRGLGGGFEQRNNPALMSPPSMLDSVGPQGGAHVMHRDGRLSEPQVMHGVNRMPMDRGAGGAAGSGHGMGHAWQHAAHPTLLHGGYNSHDLPSDMMPVGSSFGLRAGEMPRQHNPADHNLGRMPLAGGDRGLSPLCDPMMMPGGGNHLHGMSHMGNGQQYRVPQMRTSDPASFGAQPQQQGGMGFMAQQHQSPGIQQQQPSFGAAQNANAAVTGRGRSQRAAAQAARGRSFAAAADPFDYLDD